LMALHDIETMTQIAQALKEIDPTIMIYGEPWMGGTSPLPATDQAGKRGLKFIPNVGAFNDDFRDAVKGSVFNRTEGGFLQGNFSALNRSRIQYGIVGGIQYEGINPSNLSTSAAWHIEPTKTINYVTAHDNNTLHDKLHISLTELGKLHLLPALMKQGNAMVLTAQGVAFLHAGDEFSRSKPLINRPGFDHNSYESPDEVNQMRWDLKANSDGMEMFNYYKGLIQLRNNHPSFRMPTAQAIRDNLTFVYQDVNKVVAFTLSNTFSNDTLETILVVHNGNDSSVKIKLPTNGGWVVIVNGEDAGVDELETFKGGQTVSLSANATYVMYQDTNLPDYSPIGWIIGGVSGGVGVIGVVLFFLLKRKVVS
ncbi:MAG: hypothetical protein U1C51_06030, partial [Candidatus Izemoplasmatales bacterium]|nr:hypothetical protein [Candidatus Izemoplasmatales bacterium]